MLPFNKFDSSGVPDESSSSEHDESGEVGNHTVKQTQLHGTDEDWGESGNILYQNNTAHQQVPPFLGLGGFDNSCFDLVSTPYQLLRQEEHTNIHPQILELPAVDEGRSSSASFAILNNYGSKFSRKLNMPRYDAGCAEAGDRTLSTTDMIRLAGEKFIQSSSQRVDYISELSHPFSISFSGLSDDKTRDVQVIHHLLAAAEKVGREQFDQATNLLNQCDEYSSTRGNPAQRLVYYFSEALRERINQDTGGMMAKGLGKMKSFDIGEAVSLSDSALLALNKHLPFCQVIQFTGMQAILENVTEAKKIHIVDLEIRIGTHWSILIQALASRRDCPVEHLKITALKTKSNTSTEEIGMLLKSFAQSMNLAFSFRVVIASDMLDLNESLFELNSDEVVAVYSSHFLWTMIGQQDRLECLMRVIKGMNPCAMVVAETEASLNSPIFANRFIEALFYYGAFFDCMVDCMSVDDTNRNILESLYVGPSIRNIMTAKKEDRRIRHVTINVWRTFFAQFKMEQKELSMSSLYQATLVSKNFACGTSCSLYADGKSLIIGWKGTSVLSLSVWKFI